MPDEAHLRRIAPARGLHAADLFAIAWLDLPDDLAPLDPRAEYPLYHLASYASRLSPEQARELRERANQLPPEPHPGTNPVADLIWDARRLTSDQIRELRETAMMTLRAREDRSFAS